MTRCHAAAFCCEHLPVLKDHCCQRLMLCFVECAMEAQLFAVTADLLLIG